MVLWICLGIVVFALGVLLVLVLELRAKQQRLAKAVSTAQSQTAPAVQIISSLQQVQPPRKPVKPTRHQLIALPEEI